MSDEEFDKARALFCGCESASVIGRCDDIGSLAGEGNWEDLDEEVALLKEEVDMVESSCDVDIDEECIEKLEEGIDNRDRETIEEGIGILQGEAMGTLERERRKALKERVR